MRVVGLDLGQTNDRTAAAVLESDGNGFACRAIRRWPTQTDYCQVVADVLDLKSDVIVPDMCGVGRPVVDLLRREAMIKRYAGKIRPVTTVGSQVKTASTKMEQRGLCYTAPKIELVTSIQILQQTGRLTLPPIPETKILLEEMADYRMKYSAAGNKKFGNKPGSGKNDDVVACLSLACWYVLRFGHKKPAIYIWGSGPVLAESGKGSGNASGGEGTGERVAGGPGRESETLDLREHGGGSTHRRRSWFPGGWFGR